MVCLSGCGFLGIVVGVLVKWDWCDGSDDLYCVDVIGENEFVDF